MNQDYQILLIRHGEPNFEWPERCSGTRFIELCAEYRDVGLSHASCPPDSLKKIVSGISKPWYFSSDLPRAVQSGVRLVCKENLHISPLFAELEFPYPAQPWACREPQEWADALISKHNQSSARAEDRALQFEERLIEAATYLVQTSLEGRSPVVFAHGVFNEVLAGALAQAGWSQVSEQGQGGYWSWRKLAIGPQYARRGMG